MNGRRVLVVACNDSQGSLKFIPELPQAFHAAMSDPNVGNCTAGPAPFINPSRDELLTALGEAIQAAARDRDHLIVYLLGHGVLGTKGSTYYFGESPQSGIDLASELLRLLDNSRPPAGFALILDTCHSGSGAIQAATVCAGLTEYTTLAAVTRGLTYNGDFTRTLLHLMQDDSLEDGSGTISLESAGDLTATRLKDRERPYFALGKQSGRGIPYLARNPSYNGLGGRSLPPHYQEPKALQLVIDGLRQGNSVYVTGNFGAGKTTIAIALTSLYGPRGSKSPGYFHAVLFLTPNTTTGILADQLCAQLSTSFGRFRESLRIVDESPRQQQQAGNPFETRVLQPLDGIKSNAVIRILIDGYGEPSRADAAVIRSFLRKLAQIPRVRIAVFGQRLRELSDDRALQINITNAAETDIENFLLARGIQDAGLRRAILRGGNRNWQQTSLLAALAENGEPASSLVRKGQSAYIARLLEHLDRGDSPWSTHLAPVLGIVALAGKGPIIPVELLTAASAALNGPSAIADVQLVLDRLSELLDRSDAGRHTELVGIASPQIADYLFRDADAGNHLLDRNAYETALVNAIESLAPRAAMWNGRVGEYAWQREADHLAALRHPALLDSLRLRQSPYLAENRKRWEYWKSIFDRTDGDRSLGSLYAAFHIALLDVEILHRGPSTGKESAARLAPLTARLEKAFRVLQRAWPEDRITIWASHEWSQHLASGSSVKESSDFCEKLAVTARGQLSDDDFVLHEIESTCLIRRKESANDGSPNATILKELEALLQRVPKNSGEKSRNYLSLQTFKAALIGETDPGRSVSHLQQILREQRTLTTEEDETILTTRHNLVAFRLKLDDEEQTAIAFQEAAQLVEDQIRYFGRAHYDTIQTRLLEAAVGLEHGFRSPADSHVRLTELLEDAAAALSKGHELLLPIRGWRTAAAHHIAPTPETSAACRAILDELLAANLGSERLKNRLAANAGATP